MKIKLFTIAALLGLTFLISCEDEEVKVNFEAAPAASIAKSATVQVITENKVRYHVLIFGGVVTSTIVESVSGATIVDVGFGMIPNSGPELRAYANALKKPLSVIITHDHRDHFGNLDNFKDVPVYAETKNVKLLLADPNFTVAYPNAVVGVTGTRMIGGVEFAFDNISNTEAPENGFMYILSEKVIFPGDITFNNAHAYIRDYTPLDNIDELSIWIAGLKDMKTKYGSYKYIFIGHNGYSSNVTENLDKNINYLSDAQGLIKGTKPLKSGGFAKSVKQVVDEMVVLYPTYENGGLRLALPDGFFSGDPGAAWFK